MSGLVVIAAGELGRYTSFVKSLGRLQVPPGTRMAWSEASNPARGCNRAIRENPSADWVWCMGDDHVFAPDLLLALLAREVDIIVPLCARRALPLSPVLYRGETIPGYFDTVEWYDLPLGDGLMTVYAAGNAGMLIRRPVLDAVGDPWFENGQTRSEELGEDLHFCRKARACGFAIHVDLDHPMGHTGAMTVWPHRSEDGWGVAIDVGGQRIALGAARDFETAERSTSRSTTLTTRCP